MTDDEFEDILDRIHHYFPLRDDKYARAEYDKAVARIVNTGGEEQCAQLQEMIASLTEDGGREAEDPDDADGENDSESDGAEWKMIGVHR